MNQIITVSERAMSPDRVPGYFQRWLEKHPKWQRGPFAGAKLVPTGTWHHISRKPWETFIPGSFNREHDFALVCDVTSHLEIPGHTFIAVAETEDGAHWITHEFKAGTITKEMVRQLDGKRCDVCHKRISRKRLYILIEDVTGQVVVVGGACSKKFQGIDLVSMTNCMFRQMEKFYDELSETFCGQPAVPVNLAEIMAVSEAVIDYNGGYKSQRSTWNRPGSVSTADVVRDVFHGRAKSGMVDDEKVKARILDLVNQDFADHKAYFKNQIAKADQQGRFDEFANNCLQILEAGRTKHFGIAVFLGSIKNKIIREQRTPEKEKTKGYAGVPVGKCADLGEFEVVYTRREETSYGDRIAFLCINANHEKLWFTVGYGADHLWPYFEMVRSQAERGVKDTARVFVTLRGSLASIQTDITFGKRIKIVKVREEV